jgi:hypothetical protein
MAIYLNPMPLSGITPRTVALHEQPFGMGVPASPSINQTRLLIRMPGFQQDVSWAQAMEAVIRDTSTHLQNFPTFTDLLNRLSTQYRHYKQQSTSSSVSNSPYYQAKDAADFAQLRQEIQSTEIKDRYLPYQGRVSALLDASGRHWMKISTGTTDIPLTMTARVGDKTYWIHPSPQAFRQLSPMMDKLYRQTLAMKNQPQNIETRQAALRNIATLHWLLVQTMPYKRGTAGLADIMSKTLMDALKLPTGPWKAGLAPDLEALTRPLNDFVSHYAEFFETSPIPQTPPGRLAA